MTVEPLTPQQNHMTYDGENRMTAVTGGAAASYTYVSSWERNVTAAQYVRGKTKPEDFVNALLAHGYNSKDPNYKSTFLGIAGAMPGHMADCGVSSE